MSWIGVSNVQIQFGSTSITTSGIAPLLVTNTELETSKTAIVATPDANLNVSMYSADLETYLISAGQDEVSTVNYLIVSSR
jgi:hypothetical protein